MQLPVAGSGDGTTQRPGDGEEFDDVCVGASTWDIVRPQPVFLHLAESGALRGRVLDIGCRTGEHALMASRLGLEATGIDAAPAVIRLAKHKAKDRNLDTRFLVWDPLELPTLGEQFDTVVDCGLFGEFERDDRSRFVDSLRAVVLPNGCYYMLCVRDRPLGVGVRQPVSEDNIRASFADCWRVEFVEPATIDTDVSSGGALAWLSAIARV